MDNKKVNMVLSLLIKLFKIIIILLLIALIYILTLIDNELRVVKVICKIIKVISPLFIGLFMAYLLNPIVEFLEKKKIKRLFSVCIVYIVIVILLFLLCYSIFPLINSEANDILKMLPKVFDLLNTFINNIINKLQFVDLKVNIKNILNGFLFDLTSSASKNCIIMVRNVISFLGYSALSLIISFYMLLDFSSFTENIKYLIPKKHRRSIIKLLKSINDEFFSFVKGTFFVAILVFISSFICFYIFGLRGSLFFAFFNALTNMIPYVGPYIGAIPIIIVAFSSNVRVGICITISVIVIQLIESYIIQPIVIGKTMKLHPVIILTSLLLFGYFFGIIGMIFATPIVAIIRTIILFIDKKYKIFNFDKIKVNDDR